MIYMDEMQPLTREMLLRLMREMEGAPRPKFWFIHPDWYLAARNWARRNRYHDRRWGRPRRRR